MWHQYPSYLLPKPHLSLLPRAPFHLLLTSPPFDLLRPTFPPSSLLPTPPLSHLLPTSPPSYLLPTAPPFLGDFNFRSIGELWKRTSFETRDICPVVQSGMQQHPFFWEVHTLRFVPLTPAVSEQHTAASCCLLGNEMIMRHGRLGLHWLLTRLQLLNNATPVARLQAGVDGAVLEVRYSGKAHWMDTADRTTLVHPLLSHPPSSGPKLVVSLLGPLLQLDT